MRQLLKFERRKLFRQKSFYICLVIAALMVLVQYYINSKVSAAFASLDETGEMAAAMANESKPTAWEMASSATSDLILAWLVMIHLTILTCLDRAQDTLKNIYGKGYTRTQVFFSKYIVVGLSSLGIYVAVVAINFIIGLVTSGQVGTIDREIALTMTTNLLDQVAHITMYFCISMAVGKFGGAFAINVAGPTVLGLALSGIDTLLHLEKFKISDYWIDAISSSITEAIETSTTKSIVWGVIGECIYIAAFIIIGLYLDKKHRC